MLGSLIKVVVSAVLFYVFVPGNFFTIPAGNSMAVIAVHAALFGIANLLLWKLIKVAKK